MKYSSQSETGKIKSIFLKRAADAFVDAGTLETQWQPLNYLARPELSKAILEYDKFESFFTASDIETTYLPQEGRPNPDSIYCRDAAIATDRGMIICNMGKEMRKEEPSALKKTFELNGIPVLGRIADPGTVEGGDVAWLDEHTLVIGHSYRTNAAGIDQLKKMVRPSNINVVVVPLAHYKGSQDVFHLMSVLSPIDQDMLLVYSPLLPIVFRNYLLERQFQLIEVPESEFDSMGCNVLALAPRECLMLEGNPQTYERLKQAGCKISTYAGKEISIKGGGGPTCLTRPILRIK
jgi:N-dimethylarginine dimethylaminohydrolase